MSAAAPAPAPVCIVCYDSFNKSTRAQTECPYCHTKICRSCLQTYLLTNIDDTPRCVNIDCGNGWEREFLDGEFTRTFRLTTYKEHRETVLKDRERARLPATQEDAATYRNAVILMNTASEELKSVDAEIDRLTRQKLKLENRKYHARQVVDSHGRLRLNEEGRIEHVDRVRAPRAEAAAFVKPCPASNCKGFLSTAWKCGLCDLYSCPDCHELKGPARDTEHTCDPEKVATVQLLARDSRGCPKCGVTITKIEGCDQMWCTACNTGFSWRTGKIAEGPIHNPHYFAWLRARGGDGAAAPAVGGVGNCDTNLDQAVARALSPENPYAFNTRNYGYMYRTRRGAAGDTDTSFLIEAWRLMREGQDLNARDPDLNEKFRELRVRYLSGELTEEAWKTALQRVEKDVRFARAVREVRDVYVGAVRDLIRGVTTPDHNKAEIRRQVQELVDYCNNAYVEVSKRFGRKTPHIEIKT